MVDIAHILDRDCTRTDVPGSSRKRVLEFASDLIAEHAPEISARALFDGLMSRERLGSTGLGEGIAIPHCRIACSAPRAALLRLQTPIDFDAMDDEPVDLLFVLAVPPEETTTHLQTLAALARVFQNADYRARLRAQPDAGALYEEFIALLRTDAS